MKSRTANLRRNGHANTPTDTRVYKSCSRLNRKWICGNGSSKPSIFWGMNVNAITKTHVLRLQIKRNLGAHMEQQITDLIGQMEKTSQEPDHGEAAAIR